MPAMMRVSLMLVFVGGMVVVSAQTKPAFEVASVKPQARPTTVEEIIAWPRVQPGGRLAGTYSTVERLVTFAYDVKSFQLIGGPRWIREEYFDVDARAGSPVPLRQLRLMTQSLLEDRFTVALEQHLGLKLESARGPVDVLVIDSVERPAPD